MIRLITSIIYWLDFLFRFVSMASRKIFTGFFKCSLLDIPQGIYNGWSCCKKLTNFGTKLLEAHDVSTCHLEVISHTT